MPGLEYLSAAVLRETWIEPALAVQERARATAGGLAAALAAIDPRPHLLGKVSFHGAENRRDEARSFAFLATYAHRLSAAAAVQHLPLAQAVKESADRRDQARLVELLAPVRAAAHKSPLVREWLDSRAIFTPRAITILGLGACLADDMGLGKTVQVIDLLLRLREDEAAVSREGKRAGGEKRAATGPRPPSAELLEVVSLDVTRAAVE